MILYFSGTGNSRYLAERIAAATGDNLLSINDLLKRDAGDILVSEDRPWVFVAPVYAWRLPRVVEQLLRKTVFIGSRSAYFILTCGSDTGRAADYAGRLCRDKGWQLRGFAEVKMPENYIALYPVPEQDEALRIIRQAEPLTDRIAEDISQGRGFAVYKGRGLYGKLMSGLINPVFYALIVHARGFHLNDKCVGCGRCEELCPLNNISLPGQKPAWGDNCTHCMACICGCPEAAIEYKRKTQGKPRYFLDMSK